MKERSAAGWVRVLFLELKRCLIEHLMLIEEEVYVGATRKYRRFENLHQVPRLLDFKFRIDVFPQFCHQLDVPSR